jgi:hypothetical protein
MPYKQAGWQVYQVDIQLGVDIMRWDFKKVLGTIKVTDRIIIVAMIPCTDYALSGAKHFARKDVDGTT